MKDFSVLIADDNQEWCYILKEQFERHPNYHVLSPAHNGEDTIYSIENFKPDIIILDLIMPIYDGLYIATHIRNTMLDYHPFIYVLSAIGTHKTNQVLRNLDVDYYSIKPINSKAVVNNINELLVQQLQDCTTPDNVSIDIDLCINDYLWEMGASISLISTKCTRMALKYCIQKESSFRGMMSLYALVAQDFEPAVSTASIERNIRSTVKSIKSKSNSYFQECFPSIGKSLNNATFLLTSAHIIKQRIEASLYGKRVSR